MTLTQEECGRHSGDPDRCNGNAGVGVFFIAVLVVLAIGLVFWWWMTKKYKASKRGADGTY